MRASIADRPTSPHSPAGTPTDVRAAARSLADEPSAALARRRPAAAMAGGAALAVLLVALIVSVIWVSDDSKHPILQRNPAAPTKSSPTASPTAVAGQAPLPALTPAQPAPAGPLAPPAPAGPPAPPLPPASPMPGMRPSQVTAETITPAPKPPPLHWRLHQLFPHLFPSG